MTYKPLKILDMPMGTGKTTGIIQYMNSNQDKHFLFVTPYITERERIQSQCPDLEFHIPANERSRLSECHRFIKAGKNIATTHALFSRFNTETMELLSDKHYTLIIDEEPDCIFGIYSISSDDFQMLQKRNCFEVVPDTNQLIVNTDTPYQGQIDTFKDLCEQSDGHTFYLVDDLENDNKHIGIISVMNPDIFNYFDEIFVLTYLFKDSNYDCYCRFWHIPYACYYIEDNMLRSGQFDDARFRAECRSLMEIYKGNLNFRPRSSENLHPMTLSKRFYQETSQGKIKRIQKHATNYIRNKCQGKQKEVMWSVYKDYREKLEGGGCYSRSFVPCNCRATNKYRNKSVLAYLLNLYPHPYLKRWLNKNEIEVNDKHFPLTMLLQWVFRSRIRDGEPIKLYLPSARMRDILQEYLTGTIC